VCAVQKRLAKDGGVADALDAGWDERIGISGGLGIGR
jgi:hypothetical protein